MASDPASLPDLASIDWRWLLPLVAILSAAALWFIRRRWFTERGADSYDEEEEDAALTQPTPPPGPKLAPSAPRPAQIIKSDETIGLTLEVMRLSATLVSTTLVYKLTVANLLEEPIGPIVIAGDMIAAHASLPVEQQLATDGQLLELRHEIPALASGESIEIAGELRLPLSSINPIRSGTALLFIPLVRFRAEAKGSSMVSAFAIGDTPQVATASLLPFRLDLGPRVYSRISQRRIAALPRS